MLVPQVRAPHLGANLGNEQLFLLTP
jgi:hypothetical protein